MNLEEDTDLVMKKTNPHLNYKQLPEQLQWANKSGK